MQLSRKKMRTGAQGDFALQRASLRIDVLELRVTIGMLRHFH